MIAEVRGQGLMLGPAQARAEHATSSTRRAARSCSPSPAGDNVVRLLPPLIVAEAEIGEAVARLERACEALEAEMRTLARRGAAE